MAEEKVIVQQVDRKKVKGVVDVVFCIDASGSMNDVIEGLKQHINNFVDKLNSNQQISSLDLRLGIIAYDHRNFHKLDFTDDIGRFQSALNTKFSKWDEFTLPALDWALDFEWRKATRIVVVFTDEPLKGGHNPELQRSKLDELIKKIANLRVTLFFVGIDCPEYEEIIQRVPRATGKLVERTDRTIFTSYGFSDLLDNMGKTLSESLTNQQDVSKSVEKDIYNVSNKIKLINL